MKPEWATKFVLDYSFEERQQIRLDVYDWDVKRGRLEEQDFLGKVETTLGQVVSARQAFATNLQGGKGKLFVTAEELQANKEVATVQLAAKGLDNKDTFGKSDPFFVISKAAAAGGGGTGGGSFVRVLRSEVVDNNLSPKWKVFRVSVRDICNNDYKRPLKIDVYDHDSGGSYDLIGSATTDLETLVSAAATKAVFPLINEKKRSKKRSYKNSGELYVKSFSKEMEITFLDYIQVGTNINKYNIITTISLSTAALTSWAATPT